MKKQLLMIGIMLVLLTVGLSGCETKQDGDQLNGAQDETELEGKIAFSSAENIYIINPDGTNEIRLTEGVLLAWSPDGKKIAYGYDGINVMNSDGTDEIKINISDSDIPQGLLDFKGIYDFRWSPDGKKILNTKGCSIDGVYYGGVYTINVDGSNLDRLVEGWCNSAAFSPDGKKIVYGNGSSCIYIMNYDGTDNTILCEGERGYCLMYSPDGNKISYLDSSYEGDLYVMNYDGTDKVKLAETVWWPTWSPDGKKIAYSQRNRFGNDPASLYISNPDGTGKVTLIDDVEETYHLYLPHSWSPDGKKIVYNLDENIYIINIDGSDQTQLAVGFYPQWSPQ